MENQLQELILEHARDAFYICGGVRNNACDVVSNEFAHLMESEFGWTVHSPVRATPRTGGKHFVAIVDASSIKHTESTEKILVDMTLSQFSDEYPDELVEPLNSTAVQQYYSEVKF